MSASNIICQICGRAALEEFPQFAHLPRVTSDCKPFPAGGRLAICECGAIQKPIDAHWQKEADSIYEHYEIYFQSGGVEQPVFDPLTGSPRGRSAVILERFAASYPIAAEGKVLDVGCGNGAMLSSFAKFRDGWQLYGHDLSELNLAALSRIPGFKHLYTNPVEALPNGFDIITMLHSLEHFDRPVEALSALRSKLVDGGHLLIEVPDIEVTPFDMLVADHVSHFTRYDMARLLTRAGFRPVSLSNKWVSREITAVAAPGEASTGSADPPPSEPARRRVHRQLDWLHAVIAAGRSAAATGPGAFGLFGTSIAAAWLFGELGDAVSFFVDEDPSRRGGSLFGRPIYGPDQVETKATVFVPLIPKVAHKIAARLARFDIDLRLPPALPS
jgi:2-polyprenyl-3-methyl-5-hydroxy-6-metoxy-1,4-benzoquinol methylase